MTEEHLKSPEPVVDPKVMYRIRHSDTCFPQAGSSPPRLAWTRESPSGGLLPAPCTLEFPSTGQIHQTRKPSASPINTPSKQPPSPSHAHMVRSWTSLIPFSIPEHRRSSRQGHGDPVRRLPTRRQSLARRPDVPMLCSPPEPNVHLLARIVSSRRWFPLP
jgi:hypothetical protein